MFCIFLDFNINGVLTAGGVVGAVGLIIGIMLGFAAKKLSVKTDERIALIRECLPGSNCGGCGFAGCDACAGAIASGKAPVNSCNGAQTDKIAEIMGTEAVETVKMKAFVKCSGTCDRAAVKYNYVGIHDCRKMALIPGHGEKECVYGCIGYGSCVEACAFNAIRIVNGVAVTDSEKCTGCGKCMSVCPNSVIEMRPETAKYTVACSSKDKGREAKEKCDMACIGCGICARQCENNAITLENNLARIDYGKCTGCGKCASKCPQKIIVLQ